MFRQLLSKMTDQSYVTKGGTTVWRYTKDGAACMDRYFSEKWHTYGPYRPKRRT